MQDLSGENPYPCGFTKGKRQAEGGTNIDLNGVFEEKITRQCTLSGGGNIIG